MLERLSAADEPDESRAAVVEHTCRHDDHPERAVAFIEAVVVGGELLWQPDALLLNLIKALATAIATVGRFFAYKRWVFF